MSSLLELVEKRSEHEALKAALQGHGQCLISCACWHNDIYGTRRLQEKLGLMQLLAERLEQTLIEIRDIEAQVFAAT